MNPWENNESEYYEARPKVTAAYQADGLAERVTVPGLKAVIVAVPAGLLIGLIIGAFDIQLPVWYAMPIVTLLVFLFVFWGSSQRGQWLIEKLTGADLNADGYIGKPEPQQEPALPASIRVEVSRDEGRAVDFIDLPYPEKLPALARGLLAGRQFAQTSWVGAGQLFSRSEFDQVRDTMIERGLAAWKNPEAKAQGVTLTAAGRAVMRRLANPSPTLPPGQDS